MDELDEASKKRIDNLEKLLLDDKFFRELVGRVMSQTFNFYFDTPRPTLIRLLREKMINGAKEHGPADLDQIKLLKEIRNEDLDKLGWNIILEETKSTT